MPVETTAQPPPRSIPRLAMLTALGIVPLNIVVWRQAVDNANSDLGTPLLVLFTLLALCQLVCGFVALIGGVRAKLVGPPVWGGLAALGAIVGWVMGALAFAFASGSGGAWGRPLRVRGKQLHPELKAGADWTRGERPSTAGLDAATCAALEALWLHDAQKEHASVPAFARVSWMLAAAGAPAELLEWSHRAALEEIEHTRLCFALAAGFGGRSHTVEPMPDLLLGALEVKGNALEVLAVESLTDGCQLEDFNADVAAACAEVCREPVIRAVLQRIAVEERSHAEFSWAVVAWLLRHDRHTVAPALQRALASLEKYPRPTAVSADKTALVARADAEALLHHGRLPDARWSQLWETRLRATRLRVAEATSPELSTRAA